MGAAFGRGAFDSHTVAYPAGDHSNREQMGAICCNS